jgi:hypothetical protein
MTVVRNKEMQMLSLTDQTTLTLVTINLENGGWDRTDGEWRETDYTRLDLLAELIAQVPDAGLTAFSAVETKGDQRAFKIVASPAGSFGDVGEAEHA